MATQVPDTNAFTEAVKDEVAVAESLAKKEFSDLLSSKDATEVQWVDLVLEGGGLLGIGTVGYTYILEKAGLRFRSIAGTSAGAINALLIAALRGTPDGESSTKTLDILANTEFSTFLDREGPGDQKDAKELITYALTARKEQQAAGTSGIPDLVDRVVKQVPWWRRLGFPLLAISAIKKILATRGLFQGDAFEKWMKEKIGGSESKQKTVADLRDWMSLKDIKINVRKGVNPPTPLPDLSKGEMAIIAADVTTSTKAVFPKLIHLYFDDPDNTSPAEFVRMSMSIPFFFYPKEIPVSKQAVAKGWWKNQDNGNPIGAGYTGGFYPKKSASGSTDDSVTFVDGGVLSNFPIAEFHSPSVPLCPTFGVLLSPDRERLSSSDYNKTAEIFKFVNTIFDTSRHILDSDFLYQNPDYNQLIGFVNTAGFDYLDFSMPKDQQIKLFKAGAVAALTFLQGFDWNKYKETRRRLLEQDLVPLSTSSQNPPRAAGRANGNPIAVA